jgi:ABC-2 type transport system permease protein
MSLFTAVSQFEIRQFKRSPVVIVLFFFLLLIGVYSLLGGYHIINRQTTALKALEQQQQIKLKELHARFSADTTVVAGIRLSDQAGVPQVIEFRRPPVTTHPPHRLAVLAIGQRDLLPFFDIVNSKYDVLMPPNAEFVNAEVLAAGNFDLSYFIIYLLPLLIIAATYNCYSREEELHTLKLLVLQGGSTTRIVRTKFMIRFVFIWWMITGLSVAGYALAGREVEGSYSDLGLWIYVVTLFMLCWFAGCYLVVKLKRSSRQNLIILLSFWLVITIILPGIINSAAEITAPTPLRSDLASKQRENKEETWAMPIPALLDSFYQYHPDLITYRQSSDTASYGNRRFMAYYDLLRRRMDQVAMAYRQQLARHLAIQRNASWCNPAMQSQYLFNYIAASGLSQYEQYELQVKAFRERWLLFMNSYMFFDKRLTEADLDKLPAFSLSRAGNKQVTVFKGSVPLLLFTGVLLLLSMLIRPQQNK